MAITINEVTLNDGDPLLVNGVQAQAVTVNGDQAWVNTVPPSAITNFVASSSGLNTIVTVTFTPATGIPGPTYNLFENNALVASGISSGHVYTSAVRGNNTYRVDAVNVGGTTPSNNDTALVYTGASSPLIITGTRSVTAGVDFPMGISLAICISGGGGGGSATWNGAHHSKVAGGGGGGSGSISKNITVPIGTAAFNATIGAGGARGTIQYPPTGGNGGTSSFGSYASAAGGAGGSEGVGGAGANGGANGGNTDAAGGNFSGCGGSRTGGSGPSGGGGGAGGFGNGGLGGDNSGTNSPGGAGGVSSGGGGGGRYLGVASYDGGAGGRGHMVISW